MLTTVPKCASRPERLAACCAIAAALLGCTDATPRDSGDAAQPTAADKDKDKDAAQSTQSPDDAGTKCADENYPRLQAMLFESRAGDAARSGSALDLTITQTISGVVQAHGAGFPTFAAPSSFQLPIDPDQFKYLRIADGSRELTLAARGLPDWGVREGTHVELSAHALLDPWRAVQAALVIRAGDELAFLFGAMPTVEELPSSAGFAFRRAELVCEAENMCGVIGSYELGVTPPSGDELRLPPASAREIDGLRIEHVATHVGLRTTAKCADYSPARTQLTISRPTPIPPPPFKCEITEQSSLPGVHIRVPSDAACQFTLDQARAGIRIPYSIRVDHDIEGFASDALDIGGCEIPDPGVFGTFEQLTGNAQFYAMTDVGGCFGQPLRPGTLRQGEYNHSFEWNGRNWRGPSDTGQPKGDYFPAGIYTLTIRAKGYSDVEGADAGSGDPFEASTTLRVLLRD